MMSAINDCAKNPEYFKKYKCATGKCTSMSSNCPTSWKCKAGYRNYFCPSTGWCESMDIHCLRPCGFKNSYNKYDAKCDGYIGLCAEYSLLCPPSCASNLPYKCQKERKCARGPTWCEHCSGFRCESDGKCIRSCYKCNKERDCSDGSDELNCLYNDPIPHGDQPIDAVIGMETWQISAIVGGVLLVLLLCCCWCCRKNKDSDGEQSASATNQEGQTATSSGPRLAGATPPRLPGATHPSGPYESVYTPYPSPTPVPLGQLETGYFLVETVPTNNTPSSYPPATSIYPVYQPAASAPAATENPLTAPPPSYVDVVENEDQYKPKDPALPTYQEYTSSPSVKTTFM